MVVARLCAGIKMAQLHPADAVYLPEVVVEVVARWAENCDVVVRKMKMFTLDP